MQLITVAGPPSSGKTSVILKVFDALKPTGIGVGVVKFDSLSTKDLELYQKKNIPAQVGLAGNLCPDHFFISNIQDCLEWAKKMSLTC